MQSKGRSTFRQDVLAMPKKEVGIIGAGRGRTGKGTSVPASGETALLVAEGRTSGTRRQEVGLVEGLALRQGLSIVCLRRLGREVVSIPQTATARTACVFSRLLVRRVVVVIRATFQALKGEGVVCVRPVLPVRITTAASQSPLRVLEMPLV